MSPIHVLHLEDSPLDAELILASLADGGINCTVVRVDTRAAFLSALRSGPADLILADYSLPSFDGIAALHLAHDLCPEVPFIFVSGALGEELAIETLKNGATDYVLKHRLERLAPAVQRALREARERAERLKAREELRESEERFRLLVESTEDYAIISLDPEGKVVSWNPGAERTLGYLEEEIVGKPFDLFFAPEDVAAGRPARELQLAEETGRAADENWLVRRDGTRFWASGVTTSLRDEAGGLRGFAKILRDLSERKQLEEALRFRAEQLAESDRRKDDFLAMLGHELRNPLAPIRNAAEVMGRNGLTDPNLKWVHGVIERQARHLARLVDDLLDIARINQDKITLRREPVELATVVRQSVETARPQIEARRHQLTVSMPDQPVWLDADPTRLAQVFANLLNNAAKYTDEGGRITLLAETEDGGRSVVVRVRDTGTGISRDLLTRVFEPFIQADKSLARTQGGLGIGLTLVRRLTEMHDGRVEAFSEGPGKGSEFVVHLPARRPGPVATATRPGKDETRGGRSILLVDDNVDAAESLAMVLELQGNRVRTRHDGPSALVAVGEQRPDVVVLDIGLPLMDGYEVARRLRAAPGGDKLMLIALTGYGQSEDKQRATDAGFDYHLVKPVAPGVLEKLIAGESGEQLRVGSPGPGSHD
jgi:PAS domain S-box-containing protein